MLVDKFTQYSGIIDDVKKGAGFLTYGLNVARYDTSTLVSSYDRLFNPFRVYQRLYSGPLPYFVRTTDTENLDVYSFDYTDVENIKYLSGNIVGSCTDLPIIYMDIDGNDLISDLLSCSFFSILDEDFGSAFMYLSAGQGMMSMAEEEIMEVQRGNSNRRDNIIIPKSLRV